MKKILALTAVTLASMVLTHCAKPTESSDAQMSTGFQVLQNYCFNCHSPEGEHATRVAPPLFAIKSHYINDQVSEEDFAAALMDFVKEPSAEKTKMPGAVKRFGVMPRMEFTDDQLRAVAAYIYHTPLERPDWYQQHFADEKKKYLDAAAENLDHSARGQQWAMATKAVLGKNLLQAIQQKGTVGAIEFCNTRAIPLTDSMSTDLAHRIRRVSDRPRNPSNQANFSESEYILRSKHLLDSGEQIPPMVQQVDGRMVGYYPITTNAMCLQCHGAEDRMDPATIERLKSLYPNDKATGYGENELRGIWVVDLEDVPQH